MPDLTVQSISASFAAMAKVADFDGMEAAAREIVSGNYPIVLKYAAVNATAVRHRDQHLALRLIDQIRDDLKLADYWCRLYLAFYETRMVGKSDFTADLSDVDRAQLSEAVAFWASNPLDSATASAKQLMAGALSADAVKDRILASLDAGRPFSLLRMGDGEGRFVKPLAGEACRQKSEEIARRIWFWNSSFPTDDFWGDMRSAFSNADVVGVNPPYRVDLEYKNSILGYMGVVGGNAFLAAEKAAGARFETAANWVFGELGKPFFDDLIASQKRVGFIGPHAGLTSGLVDMGALRVDAMIIPSDNIVKTAVDRQHYPDVFADVIAEIRRGVSGLWLVSAGAYGKIYCNELKKAGGVALDIGSVSDQWMGLKTR